ncbi:MAG: glycosyltransferase [Candidatus Marinimicrobia bacterium]|nr:glycosyltransferase [Candidatus Neomarinimicrobiota bacterium]
MAKSEIRVSVVLCTTFSSSLVERTVESIVNQEIDRRFVELILVINGKCSDVEIGFLDKYKGKFNIVVLKEKRLGLSRARNRGLNAARGEFVAFVDDDAIADRCWLKNILKTFENADSRVACIGGKVLPIWESDRPRWLSDRMMTALSLVDKGDRAFCVRNGKSFLAGTNLVFRKSVLAKYSGFRADLGRVGNRLISNEENYIIECAIRDGYQVLYDPSVVVFHVVKKERLKKKWFYRRMFYQGISNGVMDSLILRKYPRFFLKRLFLTFFYLCLLTYLLFILFLPVVHSLIFTIKCHVLIPAGYIWFYFYKN